MNRAITITLSGQAFQIEEEAYEKLKSYLEDVKRNLSTGPDTDEIINDIEASLAEKFSTREGREKAVITKIDVEDLIKIMGDPEVFLQKEEPEDNPSDKLNDSGLVGQKKLYRSSDDIIIAGVCSGLAAYFGIETALVRLLFGISIFFGGAGVVLYILLWIIVPEAKTSSQKMAMQGKPVTLASIEKTVKENVSKINNEKNRENIKTAGRKILELPFNLLKMTGEVIRKILRALLPIIRILSGSFLFLIASIGFASLTFLLFAALLNTNNPYLVTGVPLAELLKEPRFISGLIALYLFLTMPVIFLGQGAVSLLRRKNTYSLISVGLMFAVFMASGIATGLAGLEYGPKLREKAAAAEVLATKEIPLSDFKSVSASSNLQITVLQGQDYKVVVSGNTNNLDRIKAEVLDNRLYLSQARREGPVCLFCNDWHSAQVTVTLPEISSYHGDNISRVIIKDHNGEVIKVELEDSANAEIEGTFTNLNFILTNNSSLSFSGTATTTELDLSGAARIQLNGSTDSLSGSIGDAGRLGATGYQTKKSTLDMSGAARAEINSEEELSVNLLDASRLSYFGQASPIIKMKSAGAKIIKLNRSELVETEEY